MLSLIATSAAAGDVAAGADSAMRPVHPDFRLRRDASLLGGGITLVAASQLLDPSVQFVPPDGLDAADIRWSFDRKQIGKHNPRAVDASDLASAASVAFPMVVAFASQPPGQRVSGTLRRSVVYLESFLIATGSSLLIKNSADRPRPYTYLAAVQRSGEPTYDVTEKEAFQSMPSSHASSSFCGAAFAMTDQLISRPYSGWTERVGVAFAGGLLASTTSALRVSAGKHFPSDVVVGGAIGMASGVLVPLAHHYASPGGRRSRLPSMRAWLQAFGGMCAGIGAGVLIVDAGY